MIRYTQSYVKYRELSQAHIDFVVLVCHAVPALRADMAGPSLLVPVPPDYFKQTNSNPELQKAVDAYEEELSRTAFLTVFSYFEAFLKGLLQEIAQFHGGAPEFQKLALGRVQTSLSATSSVVDKSKEKLQDTYKAAKADKYRKHTKVLRDAGYRFPSELLSHFGVVNFLRKSKDDRDGMRASEIVGMIRDGFCYPLSTSAENTIEESRKLRNKVAHGGAPSIGLKKSMNMASALRKIALGLDQHVVKNFLVIQKYA